MGPFAEVFVTEEEREIMMVMPMDQQLQDDVDGVVVVGGCCDFDFRQFHSQSINRSAALLPQDSAKSDVSEMKYLQMLEVALHKAGYYRPNVNALQYGPECVDKVGCEERDKAVTNIRCLHIFYGFSPESFALSINLLDRFITKVKVRPKYLLCIATACYFIAVKTVEEEGDIPYATELVKLSQCGGAAADLVRMEGIILDKLSWDLNPITTVTFLNNFYAIFIEKFPELASNSLLESAISKLEVCMCHYGFYGFQSSALALAIFSCALQEFGASVFVLSAVIDMQAYCKVSDMEFLQCRGMVIDFFVLYYGQKSKMPKEKRKWLISQRTMNQLRPTFDYEIELPTIQESDDDYQAREEIDEFSSAMDHKDYGAMVESLPYFNETVFPVL